jgi:hypothetical protein
MQQLVGVDRDLWLSWDSTTANLTMRQESSAPGKLKGALQLSDMCDCPQSRIFRGEHPSEIGTPFKQRVGWNVPQQSPFRIA